jgi:hypothetical protein
VQVRRSARARRLALKVSRLDGTVTLTLPPRASMRMARAFLADRATWLRNAVQGIQGPVSVQSGTRIPVQGHMLTLTPAPVRAARIDATALLVPQGRPVTGALAFLRALARDRLADRVDTHARAIGRRPGKLTLRDTRSRWGSCTPSGDLMFSWRLIMAPPPILDYVAAHEVAHLLQMNHSPAFWAEVEHLYPDHAAARRWLKTEGAGLHHYRFTDA